jgi:hypothetical protein
MSQICNATSIPSSNYADVERPDELQKTRVDTILPNCDPDNSIDEDASGR